MAKWINTKYPGVRYREHATRKHGVQPDKYFAVRYTLDGKRHEEALGWASEGWTPANAAEELARLKRAQRIGEGAYTLAERREQEKARKEAEEEAKKAAELAGKTFSTVWKEYLPNAKANKTFKAWDTEVHLYQKWIKPVIGDLPMPAIAAFHLEKLKKTMLDAGRAPRSVEYALAVVRQVFNYARDHELFSGQLPIGKVKIPRADNRRIRFLTYEEAEELLAELSKRSQDLHDMALIALHCGPRAGEIFGLSWKDIDFNRGLVTLRHTKNGHVRHVPMTDRVREMLKNRELVRDRIKEMPKKHELKQNQDNDLVFPSRNGDRIKKVSHAFERTVKDLGWNKGLDDARQKVVFHSLRHTCASWLVMAGVPLYTVKEYLGHRQISQTERYAHLAPDSLQQATAALNGMGKQEEEQQGKVINMR